MMKPHGLFAILILFATNAVGAALLADLELSKLVNAPMPPGVTIVLEELEGSPVLRIENSNTAPTSVILKEAALGDMVDTSDMRIVYRARMASQEVDGFAYLEFWAVIGGNAYFSRALNDKFSGTQAERDTSTLFFFEAGESVESVRLGVRFEGPGTVTLRNPLLWMSRGTNAGLLAGIAGSLFGVGSSLWACVAVLLALKGIGRGSVLGVTLGLCISSVAAVAAGLLLWSQGSAWSLWYPVVLLGGIGLVNFGIGYMVLRWWYGKTEARRITAMDMR